MLRGLFKKVVGDADQREIARLQKVVEQINALEPEFKALDDARLHAKTGEFRERLEDGETLDDVLVEAFAAVREAAKRTVGMRHYDVQMIGAMILHQGKITEMKTGEGKTLVATLPLYLNALEGESVHLVTVNDYLARRDGGWMGPVFGVLGMNVGLVVPQFSGMYDPNYVDPGGNLEDERLIHWRPVQRKEAYQADITYGTNNEFGFDYLRDNMARDLSECVQRELYLAIIDEVDNVMIDEARTPLIISGPAAESSGLYRRFADIVPRLRSSNPESIEQESPDGDYELDEKTRGVTLTERGVERVEQVLRLKQGESLYDSKHANMLPYLDNALRAYVIHKRDKDYIVKDGEVIIVDQFTGRLMYGRRFSEGLHQAIEAKERVAIRRESMTYATVTFQNYFRMYEKLAGMTGTAKTEEEEFRSIYNLDVMMLPTNVKYRATYSDLEAHERPADEIEEVDFTGVLNGHADDFGLPQQAVTVTTYEPRDGNGDERRYFKRLDMPDVIYGAEQAKFQAVASDIERLHEIGQPVLVGTIAIETSERLSQMLERRGIPHQVLNGKLHEQEAMVIAQAGSPGTVTIATNMAGRGVDIVLGGNPEGLTAKLLEQRFKKTAEKFARAIAGGREEQALEIVKGESGFSSDSIERAKRLLAEYEAYAETAPSPQRRARLIANQLLEEGIISKHYHGPVVSLAVFAMREDWVGAMDRVRLPEGLSQRIISEIQRVRAQYDAPGNKTAYIADGLFNHYYMAMSALIRAVLQGRSDSKQQALALVEQYSELNETLIAEIESIRNQHEKDRQRVCALGGLHVIGTERHESRRIDNQLRGRAGRQGDPGSSRFYISLEDELMRRFGGERVQGVMGRFGVEEDIPLQHTWLDKTIESAQTRVEGHNFDIRKHVLEYDDVVNKQREFFYGQRRQALSAPDLRDQVVRMVQEEISQLVATYMPGPDPDDWELVGLHQELRAFLPLTPDVRPSRWIRMTADEVEAELHQRAESAYDELNQKLAEPLFDQTKKENLTLADLSSSTNTLRRLAYKRALDRIGDDPEPDMLDTPIRKLSAQVNEQIKAGFVDSSRLHRDRQLILGTVDNLWVRHLTSLEVLREGIGLRAYGQQNPLIAYRKEAHAMYDTLLADTQRIVARSAYLVSQPAPPQPQRQQKQKRMTHSSQQPTESRGAPEQLPGRNAPCWCGSELKYKNCHMRLDSERRRGAATTTRPPRTSPGGKKSRRKRKR